MLRFQLYEGIKYFSANYKYEFQSRKFKFEMHENILPLHKPVKRRQIFTHTLHSACAGWKKVKITFLTF